MRRFYLCISSLVFHCTCSIELYSQQQDAPSLLTAISWPGTKQEIDIVDAQLSEANIILRSMAQKIRREVQDSHKKGNAADFGKVSSDFQEEINSELSRVFLPHQMKRLRELSFWAFANSKGSGKWLATDFMKEFLGIATADSNRILSEAGSLQAEFEGEVFELRQKYRQKLIEKLPKEQQQQMKKLFGEPSKFGQPTIDF